jgi:rubrerythrin
VTQVKPEGTPTAANLREAFAREAQATLRYLYFARRADIEGRADVASLMRALAEGETGHGFGHLEFLEETGDTLAGGGDSRSNLESAITEADGDAVAYEEYAAAAKKDRLADIADWFDAVAAAERAHAGQLRRILASMGED